MNQCWKVGEATAQHRPPGFAGIDKSTVAVGHSLIRFALTTEGAFAVLQEPKVVVEAFDKAVDSGDVAALDAVCHPDIITHSLSASTPQGIEGIRRFVASRKATGGVGRWEEVVTVAEGEYVVQYGTRSFDWPGGGFRGFDVPPGAFRRDCAFMFRVRDGLITDRWAIRDDLAMMVQLGAVSAPRPDQVMDGTVTSQRQHPFA